MDSVKIMIYTLPSELEKNICKWVNEFNYSLKGPVSVGVNSNGNIIYVATLVKGEA